MQRLIQFLFDHPILMFVLVAWAAGMIGNVIRSAKKARERAEQQRRMPQARREHAPPAAPEQPRSTEDVAAEMRRILGMETEPVRPRPRPVAPPPPQPPPPRAPRAEAGERPPQISLPTTQDRKLEIHVDPHVGEVMQRRHMAPKTAADRGLGTLGGRTARQRRRMGIGDRYSLADLKTAFVLSEIIGPPRALRDTGPSNMN